MTDKLPWMPFYGAAFYADEAVRLMSLKEEATYMRLIWCQWCEGSLPESLKDLSKLARIRVSERVAAQFPVSDDGRRRNGRLEEIRQEQLAHREARAAAGHLGGVAKAKAQQSPSNATAMGVAKASYKEKEIEKEQSNYPPAAEFAGVAEQLPTDTQRDAFQRLTRASRNPAGFVGEVRAILSGMHRLSPHPTPEQVGRALMDMSINGKPPEVAVLHSYCVRVARVARSAEPEVDEYEALARKYEAEAKRAS